MKLPIANLSTLIKENNEYVFTHIVLDEFDKESNPPRKPSEKQFKGTKEEVLKQSFEYLVGLYTDSVEWTTNYHQTRI